MTKPAIQNAVIYCRVSDMKQIKKGDGLGSQETRCREYARHKNVRVIEVFKEEGISGSLIERPRMKDMLTFLKKYKSENIVVIIDDISRLARGLDAHLQLRMAISDAGGKLESPSIEFGDDSDSLLVENLLASVSQHHRQKNAEQVKHRMRARVMNGYWVFTANVGYKYTSVPGHGKLLIKDEPVATILTEALEGYASGRFQTQAEVMRFLQSCTAFPKDKKGLVRSQLVFRILVNPLYAGYIDVPKWGIYLQPGKHEPLISFETWQSIKKRMSSQSHAPARKDLKEDFPLRGFVTCGCCGNLVTATWSKGRNKSYPYYLCYTKSCSHYKKSVRKEKMETEFEELLQNLRPSQSLFFLAKEMFQDLWEERLQGAEEEKKSIKFEVQKIEFMLEQFLDRIVNTNRPIVINSYENQIRKLEEKKVLLNEKVQNCGRPLQSFDETFRTAFGFLSNPYKLWDSDRLEDKRSVLKLVFAKRLPYYRNEGFRTAALSLPFSLLSELKGGKHAMVGPTGFEPVTYRL
jgi:site-specific DNA recombinase